MAYQHRFVRLTAAGLVVTVGSVITAETYRLLKNSPSAATILWIEGDLSLPIHTTTDERPARTLELRPGVTRPSSIAPSTPFRFGNYSIRLAEDGTTRLHLT